MQARKQRYGIAGTKIHDAQSFFLNNQSYLKQISYQQHMMKKLFFLLVAAMLTATYMQAVAEDDNKMVLNTADGNTAIPLKSISKLTFDGSKMTVSTVDGDSEVDVFSLQNITFQLAVQSVDNISKDFDGLNVSFQSGVVTATESDNGTININVYALSGTHMLNVASQGQASADLNTLAPGVYVIKINNKTFKFTR